MSDDLLQQRTAFLSTHGPNLMRAVLQGFAGVAPRSVVPNLIEILGTLLSRASGNEIAGGAPLWMKDILLSVSVSIYFLDEYILILSLFSRIILYQVRPTSRPRINLSKQLQGKLLAISFLCIYTKNHSGLVR